MYSRCTALPLTFAWSISSENQPCSVWASLIRTHCSSSSEVMSRAFAMDRWRLSYDNCREVSTRTWGEVLLLYTWSIIRSRSSRGFVRTYERLSKSNGTYLVKCKREYIISRGTALLKNTNGLTSTTTTSGTAYRYKSGAQNLPLFHDNMDHMMPFFVTSLTSFKVEGSSIIVTPGTPQTNLQRSVKNIRRNT